MKLIQISDDVFINPSLVTSVVIDSDVSDKKSGEARFLIVVTSGEDQNYLYRQLTRAQAEGFRDKIVDTINHSLQEHR